MDDPNARNDESLKQTRKDKCTTEQFWAVATVLGVNAFLLTQRSDLSFIPPWIVIVHSAVISFYAAWFVIDRAKGYREIDTGKRELRLPDFTASVFMSNTRSFQAMFALASGG